MFQSTLPMKGATWDGCIGDILRVVSIHAPNEGSDEVDSVYLQVQREFQSTLPMKGATWFGARFVGVWSFNPRSQ